MIRSPIAVAAQALALLLGAGAAIAQSPSRPPGPPVGQPTAAAPPARLSPSASRPRMKPVRKRHAAGSPLATIGGANAAARDWPNPAAYVNSALFYDFEPGRLYTIQTSPRFLTTIALKPGEKLISKAAGDTVRWVLGETQAGAGETAQVTIFVKPIRPGLRTNIVLTTDQRLYLIDAVSADSSSYTSVLSWNYPLDEARMATTARLTRGREAEALVGAVAADRLDFRYRVEVAKGRSPRWRPVRVFDDGTKTYLQFAAGLTTTEAPPLFAIGDKGETQLLNYRVSGVYYVVDRLIDTAELRLGEGRQTVVRIRHEGERR